VNVVFIGDIVGRVGRETVRQTLPWIREKFRPHLIIANGENAAHGRGLTAAIARQLFEWGVDGITMGNHTWDQRGIFQFIDDEPRLVRPANLPPGTPGRGYTVVKGNGKELAIVNLIGRTYLPPADCPFRAADAILDELQGKCKCVLVDFHAEATSEKIAMGWHLDGRASIVLGTHTHVQTNDARILPGGTAYMTDVGMTGPRDGVLGMQREPVMHKFLTGLPTRFEVAEGKWQLNALFAEIDEATGRAVQIRTIRVDEDDWIFS
jgi:metallophosphoesterase (TIGR00282 family)